MIDVGSLHHTYTCYAYKTHKKLQYNCCMNSIILCNAGKINYNKTYVQIGTSLLMSCIVDPFANGFTN